VGHQVKFCFNYTRKSLQGHYYNVQQHLRLRALPEEWVLSSDYNLCFKYPNESCEPIVDVYVPRDFSMCKPTFRNALYQRSSEEMSEPYGPRVRVNPWLDTTHKMRRGILTPQTKCAIANQTKPNLFPPPPPPSLTSLPSHTYSESSQLQKLLRSHARPLCVTQLPRPNFVSMDKSHLLPKSFQPHDICNYL